MAKLIRFTEGAGFDVSPDHKVKMVWNNGNAFDAVKGATTSYIQPHMYAHFQRDKEGHAVHYNMASDYQAMRAGNVSMANAMTVCLIRAAAFSCKGIVFNTAELVLEDAQHDETEADQALADWLVKNGATLKNVMQQSVSIMALNGISMVVNGHHYVAEQSMWNRFQAASVWDNTVQALGLVNWEGLVYHDALHPVDVNWLAKQVTAADSPFVGHVNGVVAKRMPAQPSGTLIVSVFLAMLDDVAAANPKVSEIFTPAREPANAIQRRIMADPLKWCAQFPVKETAANLKEVDRFAPLAVLLYAYLNTALERKPTSLKSKALRSAAQKNTALMILGQQLAEKYPIAELDEAMFQNLFKRMLEALSNNNNDGKKEL